MNSYAKSNQENINTIHKLKKKIIELEKQVADYENIHELKNSQKQLHDISVLAYHDFEAMPTAKDKRLNHSSSLIAQVFSNRSTVQIQKQTIDINHNSRNKLLGSLSHQGRYGKSIN